MLHPVHSESVSTASVPQELNIPEAFAAARAENASYRLENSIVVRGVEQEAHLRRLEVLVTNVLLDTGFGKQVVQQIGHTISTVSVQHNVTRGVFDNLRDRKSVV